MDSEWLDLQLGVLARVVIAFMREIHEHMMDGNGRPAETWELVTRFVNVLYDKSSGGHSSGCPHCGG
jgi:hypothetical protein